MSQKVDVKEMLEKIIQFNKQFTRIEQEILNTHQLNSSAVNLLSIIGDERMTLKAITEISELDKSTISRQINGLVKDELILRETGEDKRYSFFELSESAKMIYKEYTTSFVDYLAEALQAWSEEEKHMFSVMVGRANYSLAAALVKVDESKDRVERG